ncbi:MAG: replication-relaxation family protein, partial [Solirubrobacterales bacterium]
APVPAHAEVPSVAAESYRELVDLDGAHSVRWAKPRQSPLSVEPDRLDIEILALVAGMRHVLSSQIHRRFNPDRAATTTQRRLKRLSDAGWVRRLQFHRRDGGGTPMCYVIAEAGLELLRAQDRIDGSQEEGARGSPAEERRLRQARHDVHVSGWALALGQTLGGASVRLRGPVESVLSPPLHSAAGGRTALGPRELRLPGGRTPHEFLSTDEAGRRNEVERFETVRPDAIIEVSGVDVLMELDDRLPADRGAAKLERYDHLLAGWSVCTKRYGQRSAVTPVVVFVCRDRARARECARQADRVLTACRAYAGEYPADWEYPGRAGVVWASERDVHEGLLQAYGVQRLPPEVRVAVAHGNPRAREPEVRAGSLTTIGAAWRRER